MSRLIEISEINEARKSITHGRVGREREDVRDMAVLNIGSQQEGGERRRV